MHWCSMYTMCCLVLCRCRLHTSEIGLCLQAEISDIVKIGYLNGLFVLARSIGLIGHTLDQKRLQQPLYRHPWDEVLYI